MKRERILVQRKCNKVVTCAIPPSHHLKSENSKYSINFFSHSQRQYKLCGLNNDSYYISLPIHLHAVVTKRYQIITAVNQLWSFRAGVHQKRSCQRAT